MVQDPANKHGAIKHPDGTYRLLYSVESPESWLEDFGAGQLANGKAMIALDKDFAAIAQTSDYTVVPIPEGDCKGLYVANKTATGFEVREMQGGASDIPFRYRVVARPKTDTKGERLAKFTPPNVKLPRVEDLPKSPAPPPAKMP